MSDISAVIHEPVRGAIGDMRVLQRPGLDAARAYVSGEFPGPPIWRLTGLKATDAGPGKTTFSMPITRWLEDPFGLVWSGVFALFADAPLATAIWTGLPAGQVVTTSELNLNFLRPFVRGMGNIVGRATSIHQGRQVGLSSVEMTDGEGRIMAHGTTKCLIVEMPVDPDAEYPIPDTGPDDPADPYLREAPRDSYFDLETVIGGDPREVQDRLIAGDVRPNMNRLQSATYSRLAPGHTVITAPTSPWFSAGTPNMYGGAIAWLTDSAMGSSVYSTLGPGEVFAPLDMNIRFVRPVLIGSGDLRIEPKTVHEGRRLRVVSSEVTDSRGKTVAIATSSSLVLPGGVEALHRGRNPVEILFGGLDQD